MELIVLGGRKNKNIEEEFDTVKKPSTTESTESKKEADYNTCSQAITNHETKMPFYDVYVYKRCKHAKFANTTPFDPKHMINSFLLLPYVPTEKYLVELADADIKRVCDVHEFTCHKYETREECDRDLHLFSTINNTAKNLLDPDKRADHSWSIFTGWVDFRTASFNVQKIDGVTVLVELWRICRDAKGGGFILSGTWVVIY
jgi:hypothetical protein